MKKLRYHFDLRKKKHFSATFMHDTANLVGSPWHRTIMYEIPNWAMRLFYTVHIIKYNLNPF